MITAYLGYAVFPPFLALAGWLFGMTAVKMVSRPIDLASCGIALLCVGYALSPATTGLPYFLPLMAAIFLVPAPRTAFVGKLGFTKMIWMEPFFFAASLTLYVTANLLTPIGWEGWAAPALPLAFAGFVVLGTLSDHKQIKARLGDMPRFKAEPGKEAPDFTLPNQDGQPVKLSDYRNKNSVLLIFVRGDWCPSCHITLRTYERNKEKFQSKNVTVMSIGPDPVGVNRQMVERLGISYHILADEKHEAAKMYGIRLQDNNFGTKFEEGIPLPASFLVSPKGTVAYTSRADVPGEILNPEDIFPILERIAS